MNPMKGLVRASEPGAAWYPVPISKLDSLLYKAIHSGRGYRHPRALRKNIAYNLQHWQFLHRCISDLKLSSVIVTQTWKTMIVVGCGIIESLLHFLLIANNSHKTTEWELLAIAPGNAKKLDGETRKIDSHIYRKLSSPQLKEMSFDAMIKKAESKKVLGSDHSIYVKLRKLRPLRNKVHLQEIASDADTDWNSFNAADVEAMASVLQHVFTSGIFRPSSDEKKYFDYMPS